MDELTFNVLNIIVSLVSIVITAYLIPYLKKKIKQNDIDNLQKWANMIVLAVQQVHGNISGEGKRQKAEELLQDILEENHVELTVEQINILIESAVKSMKIAQSQQVQ